MGAGSQWRHFGRAYLYFAALATPLVVSVHSVVSWDFAMSNLPGWHSTIFAPYFVAGAIHSGLAMVLTLVIPLRGLLKLQKVITLKHFESVALTMLVTTSIVGYTYLIEPFLAWYSGDTFEGQFAIWRATGSPAVIYWALPVLNVLVPLLFVFKRFRTRLAPLFVISILVNVGMWLERVLIVYSSTSHDFLPHNWGGYWPRPVEVLITLGAFCWFLFWFFLFAKGLPTVPAADLKDEVVREQLPKHQEIPSDAPVKLARTARQGLLAIYDRPGRMLEALRRAKAEGFTQTDYFSPARIVGEEAAMGQRSSPVRYWTLIGALLGLAGGFALAIGSALVNSLIVGGKHPVSVIPYVIVGFEGTILMGALATLAGMLYHARLGKEKLPPWYDRRFSRDRFGVLIACGSERVEEAMAWLRQTGAEEIRALTGKEEAATA
jgi:molybdopterin-containing oxidoreductase family membrane subunit